MNDYQLAEIGRMHMKDDMMYRWWGMKIPPIIGHILSVIIVIIFIMIIILLVSHFTENDNMKNFCGAVQGYVEKRLELPKETPTDPK